MARNTVNFGRRFGGPPIPQQLVDNPQSVLATALLRRGGDFNANQRGSGLLNAGQNILGALLARKAADKQKEKNEARAKSQADLIKAMFPGREVVTQEAVPAGAGLPDVDERISGPDASNLKDLGENFFPEPTTFPADNRGGFTAEERLSLGGPNEIPTQAQEIGGQLAAGGGLGPTQFGSESLPVGQQAPPQLPQAPGQEGSLQLGQQFQGQSPQAVAAANQGIPQQTEIQPNQLGQLLQGFNTPENPLDRGTIANAFQQQEQIKRQDAISAQQIKREDTIAGQKSKALIDASTLKFQRDTISDAIQRENNNVQKDLDRKAALERAKVSAKRPGVQVNLGDSDDPLVAESKKSAEAIGTGTGEAFVEIQKAGTSSQKQINRLSALKQFGTRAETGKLAEFKSNSLRTIDAIFGTQLAKTEKVTYQQLVPMFTNRMALELRNPDSGGGLPGSASERDVQFLLESFPGMVNEELAFEIGTEMLIRFERRKGVTAKIAREFKRELIKEGDVVIKKRGQFSFGFNDRLTTFNKENPMDFSDLVAKVKAATPKSNVGFTRDEIEKEKIRRGLK